MVYIAPGDFDNDGLTDLAVVTKTGVALYRNVNGKFTKHADLATGSFRQAVWLDYDHDYDLDLLLIGDESKLLRNNGQAGFSDETSRFPFVKGRALSAVRFDLEPDTPGFDLVVSYQDRPGVLYRDRLGGTYEAVNIDELPAGSTNLSAKDFNHDGRTDLAAQPDMRLLNLPGKFQKAAAAPGDFGTFADFDGQGRLARARIAADGALMLDHDATPNYGNWIEIALVGVKNLKIGRGREGRSEGGHALRKANL